MNGHEFRDFCSLRKQQGQQHKQLLLLHQSSQDFFKNQEQAGLAAPLNESDNARSEMAREEETPMSEETQSAVACLDSMGFTDRAKNVELLQKHNNNVERVVNELFA